jgi:hypothetical protein
MTAKRTGRADLEGDFTIRVERARARADISQGPARLSELILPGRTGRMLRLPTA